MKIVSLSGVGVLVEGVVKGTVKGELNDEEKSLQLFWAKQQKVKVALFVNDGLHSDWQVPTAVVNWTTGFSNGPGKVTFEWIKLINHVFMYILWSLVKDGSLIFWKKRPPHRYFSR